ncbi:peptidyl-prolyl cis-trans isomerase [Streptomyces sp. NPDC048291]|uniref:peptidyl-prolyl cis-trans isomerase n=1 Tax=Streptomyces sp. NPDC048291 TaxID=3365530 RepID=UPI00371BB2EF
MSEEVRPAGGRDPRGAPDGHGHTGPPAGAGGAHAALIGADPVPRARVDALLAAVPARDPDSSRTESLARAERQRRRWATQVVVADELARRECAARGLGPPSEVSAERLLAVAGSEVADLGSIVAAALAHSAAARALLEALEAERVVPEADVRDYYERNRDRFLTPDALRRGVDPFGGTAPGDVLPYEEVREGVLRELRRAAGRRAFFGWLDLARSAVVYAHGHEHPGDPAHPDHEHRH